MAVDNYDEHILFDNIELPSSDTSHIIHEKHVDEIEPTELIQIVPEEDKREDINQESVEKKVNVEEAKKNVCPVCRKTFTSKTWFNKHMKKEHTDHKFVCAHCPKSKLISEKFCSVCYSGHVLSM